MDKVSLQIQTNHKVAILLHMLTHELRNADHMSDASGREYLSSLAVNQLGGDTTRLGKQFALSYADVRMIYYRLIINNLRQTCESAGHSLAVH